MSTSINIHNTTTQTSNDMSSTYQGTPMASKSRGPTGRGYHKGVYYPPTYHTNPKSIMDFSHSRAVSQRSQDKKNRYRVSKSKSKPKPHTPMYTGVREWKESRPTERVSESESESDYEAGYEEVQDAEMSGLYLEAPLARLEEGMQIQMISAAEREMEEEERERLAAAEREEEIQRGIEWEQRTNDLLVETELRHRDAKEREQIEKDIVRWEREVAGLAEGGWLQREKSGELLEVFDDVLENIQERITQIQESADLDSTDKAREDMLWVESVEERVMGLVDEVRAADAQMEQELEEELEELEESEEPQESQEEDLVGERKELWVRKGNRQLMW